VSVSAYKSRFLANMSHELRTPLNSMLILSNLMAQNEAGNLTDKQVEYARTIHSAGRDLLGLINQVLDLSKIESGKQELRLETVPLWELTEHSRRLFEPLARDKGLELKVDLGSDLPPAMVTDRQRLEQIVTNLLGNAIKFTTSGQVALRVSRPPADLALPPRLTREQTVVIDVSDTGVGIAPEDQARVFSPFEQVDTRTDRRYGGTGLGLTIARELAVLLGGELRLDSQPGRGSTFTCLLPLELRAAPDLSRQPVSAGALPAARPAAARVIEDDREQLAPGIPYLLVIEDDPVMAEQLVELGRERGWKVVVTAQGEDGVQLARRFTPRGIILDVRLPDIDGFAVMERLRDDPETREIPVHFLSAVDSAERGWALGAVGYLTKPVGHQELKEVVERLLPVGHQQARRVLVVEDDVKGGQSVAELLDHAGFSPQHVTRGADALAALERERFGCLILDLGLPDMDGLGLLETLQRRPEIETPPVLIHTGRALSRQEVQRLETYAQAVVMKDGHSTERLLDELRLFMQHLPGRPGAGDGRGGAAASPFERRLDGRKLLVADDDMRTIYAISALLRAKGAQVVMADTGQAALDLLAHHPDVDAILMDVMMPEMDGYEAMRRIRAQPRWHEVPIIALTAKAMKGERERCLEAGASDYLPKPVDSERLLGLLTRHLARAEPAADGPASPA
jgi:CheY-like chemotaxis protein